MNRKVAILGTAHRMREPGKCSPDKRLRECVYSREIAALLKPMLEERDIPTFIDYTPLDLPKTMQTPSYTLERQRELAIRVNYVNELCRQYGKQNVFYVSIHVDASGPVDNKWHQPNGWSVRVSPRCSQNTKLLANCLYDEAEKHGLVTRHPSPSQHYWQQSLYVLNRTDCPAVLTENLFQNNIHDVDFLLSEEGRKTIVDLHLKGIINYINLLK